MFWNLLSFLQDTAWIGSSVIPVKVKEIEKANWIWQITNGYRNGATYRGLAT